MHRQGGCHRGHAVKYKPQERSILDAAEKYFCTNVIWQ